MLLLQLHLTTSNLFIRTPWQLQCFKQRFSTRKTPPQHAASARLETTNQIGDAAAVQALEEGVMEAAAGSEGNAAKVLWDQRERGSSGPVPGINLE